MTSRTRRPWLWAMASIAGAAIASAFTNASAHADDAVAPEDPASFNARCATRLSASLLGTSATPDILASTHPQDFVERMLTSPEFIERFARFTNASFNSDSNALPQLEPAYFLAKYVLSSGKPWSELFVGKYDVDVDPAKPAEGVQVRNDTEGLGYFRSKPWLLRYAGNEPAGIKIATAYRIMQNTIGLKLAATTNAPEADISATGRAAPQCSGCHYAPWFALDHVAAILSTKVVDPADAAKISFKEYAGGPKTILGDKSVSNDAELVAALVDSENYRFNACRMAFTYLYGRAENKCEGPIFDECVDAFRATGRMQSAIAAIAKNPNFCQ